MKILITGHKGFIGSKLYEKLKEDGHIVVGVDKSDGIDILDKHWNADVDVVYHLAAQTSVMDSIKDPYKDAANNIMGTISIAEKFKNKRIIYTTSAASKLPESPYGLSKRVGEEYIQLLVNDYVICRLANIYDDKGKSIIAKIINDDEITFYGDCYRVYTHVDDIVHGLILALEYPKGVYEFGDGSRLTLSDLAVIARKHNKTVKMLPQRIGEQSTYDIGDNARYFKSNVRVSKFIDDKLKEKI